jgi:hypothetical protein
VGSSRRSRRSSTFPCQSSSPPSQTSGGQAQPLQLKEEENGVIYHFTQELPMKYVVKKATVFQ